MLAPSMPLLLTETTLCELGTALREIKQKSLPSLGHQPTFFHEG